MTRILTLFLVLHWAVVFSLLAALAVFSGGDNLDSLSFFGINMSGQDLVVASVPLLKAVVTFGFAICAVLFWWALVALFFQTQDTSAGEEVMRMAFAAASGLMTIALLVGAIKASPGLFPAMAAHFAALLASYVAIRVERQVGAEEATREEVRHAAHIKAVDASQTARLKRFVATHDGRRSFDR